MNPRRLATVGAALCGTVVLAAWVVAWSCGFGSSGIDNAGTMPIEDRRAPSPIADASVSDASVSDASVAGAPTSDALSADDQPAGAPPAPEMGSAAVANAAVVNAAVANAAVANADVPMTTESLRETATGKTAASDEPELIVEAALPDSSEMLLSESWPVQMAAVSPSDPAPNDVKEAVSSIEIGDDCLLVDSCIDRFLWALYERTPKEGIIKLHEKRKVTVKKKGKTVTVTKSFTRIVDEDFAWKDTKAAEKAGIPMIDYVIGGMDRSFKLKLFHTLQAAEQAGMSPGISSAFRDDYRQSLASGLKAASDRSYHGGSSRGGYGHGLAADVVSVKGATQEQRWASTEIFWKWIDAHGKEYGIGRPYLDRDPAHFAPIDGQEYASHRGGTKVRHAQSDMKKGNRAIVQDKPSVMRTASLSRRKAELEVARAGRN
jgi:hypothetical protein